MEIEEAIKILKHLRDDLHLESEAYVECFSMAISALEKQEGKKPDLKPKPLKNEAFWWQCPHCMAHNHTNTMHNYCHHCGQKIDWSDVEVRE